MDSDRWQVCPGMGSKGSLIEPGAQNGTLKVSDHNRSFRNGLYMLIYHQIDTNTVKKALLFERQLVTGLF